jgi:hypothetical protein
MDFEIVILQQARTWTDVERSPDGTIDKYKAPLVACRFTQLYGADYHNLIRYTDADGVSQDHCRTISGYTFFSDS